MAEPCSESMARRPVPPLRPFIDGYLGYRQAGWAPAVHRGLPSRYLTFIVSIGDPIRVVAQTDPRQAPATYGFVLGGLQASSALIAHDGRQEGVAIQLTPLGCHSLLGVPAQALWNTSIEAGDLLGPLAPELRERLHAVAGWAGRFEACDEVLGRLVSRAGQIDPADPVIAAAWRRVVASGGALRVADLAADVGWSRRQLARRFAGELGLSPKVACRVVRFERARRMLQQPQRPSLGSVAATCGYYDQPHLNREFVQMAGCAPGEWLAAEVPSVQDPVPGEPAASVA